MTRFTHFSATAFFLLSFIFTRSNAQDGVSLEIGITAGTFVYQGDLTPSPFGSYRTASYAFGLTITKRFSGVVALRGDLHTGKLRGDEFKYTSPEWRQYRAFQFETPVQEAALYLVISPFGNDNMITPYAIAGAGMAFLNIKRDHTRINEEYFQGDVLEGLEQDLQKSVPRKLPVLPSGLGLKYQMHPNWSINTEAKYRIMFTDYLDGFSLSAEPKMNDHYITYSMGVSFCAGRGEARSCPTFD